MPSMVYFTRLHKIPGSKQGKSFALNIVDHGSSESNTNGEHLFSLIHIAAPHEDYTWSFITEY